MMDEWDRMLRRLDDQMRAEMLRELAEFDVDRLFATTIPGPWVGVVTIPPMSDESEADTPHVVTEK